MMEWIESMVLGLVQGLTEFLPISSDGHLSLTQQAFRRFAGISHTPKETLFFFVMLHLGTLAAIVLHYRAVVRTGARGLLGSSEVPPAYRREAVIRVGLLAFLATLPLVPDALFLKKLIEQSLESPTAAGVGFLITAAVLLVTLRLPGGHKGPAEMRWTDALLIGLAQMFAPLPGVSRSGLTVAAALSLGLSRSWAVGFSLLIAIPAILGAAVFELKDLDPSSLTGDRVAQTVAATVLAGAVGYGAIIWLVRIVRSGHLWYFSVYLIVLGSAVLAALAVSGGNLDGPRSHALDRPLRGSAPRSGAGGREGRAVEPLDRADGPGARSGGPRSGSAAPLAGRAPGLVLERPLAGRP